ncbi:hypothetical protein ABMA58_15735, partial [Oceanospirillum sp. HFRX-1_2]
MIVKSVLLDKKRYELVCSDYCDELNAYTIIVGSNGTGKSRILKRIVNGVRNVDHFADKIPRNYSRHIVFKYEGREASLYAPSSESKSIAGVDKEICNILPSANVIAVTTTPFDKFPVDYKGGELFRYHDDQCYTYIGLKVSKNSLNQSNYMNLLCRAMLTSEKIFDNEKLFSLLGLRVGGTVSIKPKVSYWAFSRIDSSGDFYWNGSLEKFANHLLDYHSMIYRSLEERP